jgi:toxin ParE1/3/4
MATRAIKRRTALDDLEASGRFIGQDSISAELRFYENAELTFKQLAEMPGLGRMRTDLRGAVMAGLRSFPIKGFGKWLVFYLPICDGIEVVRVLHGARNLKAIFLEGWEEE